MSIFGAIRDLCMSVIFIGLSIGLLDVEYKTFNARFGCCSRLWSGVLYIALANLLAGIMHFRNLVYYAYGSERKPVVNYQKLVVLANIWLLIVTYTTSADCMWHCMDRFELLSLVAKSVVDTFRNILVIGVSMYCMVKIIIHDDLDVRADEH